MSGLGAIVLGAAFWPPEAVQRRLAVRLTFAGGLSDSERQAKLADVQAAVVDQVELAHWAADADVEAKPKPFVFARIASVLPTAVRAESTLLASPIEDGRKLTGVEVTFADSDGLRAERFAHAIVRTFEESAAPCASVSASASVAQDAATAVDREAALASIRREQDQLRKSLDAHFQELRSLRSELSDEGDAEKKAADAKRSTAESAASHGDGELSLSPARRMTFAASTRKNVLWQVSPSVSKADIVRRIEALEADIAGKKAAREELLGKFTAHHPVASALSVAIERLERERRDLEALLKGIDPVPAPPAQTIAPQRQSPSQPTPRPAVAPAATRPAVTPPAAPTVPAPQGAIPPAPVAATPKHDAPPPVTAALEAAVSPAADPNEKDEAAAEAAAAEIAANRKAVAAALERAIRSEQALQAELRSLADASKALTDHAPILVGAQPGVTAAVDSLPPTLRAEIVDLEESESVENRFTLLLAGAMLFACLMTGLTWLVSRERAVASADEVRRASGMPVVGQSSAGLLDRKPKRDLASVAVSTSLKVVEGAAFATAVFCVAALAAENPRCEQILRQPLAIVWQALQSLT
jgi:hypothetical protein